MGLSALEQQRVALGRAAAGAATTPVEVRAGGDRMVYDELYMRRPVEPGKSDTYRLSLRFGPAGSDPHDLGADVYRAFAAKHPPVLDWPDRRPIVRLFVSGGLATEHVLAYYRRGMKGALPKASIRYRDRVLEKLGHAVYAAGKIDAQGIVIWDIEGDAMPHPTTYIGDPRLTAVLNPRMDGVADTYFEKIRAAKLRCGVCIRPSHLVYDKARHRMMQSFGAAKAPFEELDAKIVYCKRRWGCTLFYIDTNYFWRPRGKGGAWTAGMIAMDVWRRLAARHPKCLLIPEHNYMEYWACTAPYNEMDLGYKGVPAWVRRVYPKAFGVAVVEDADPHEHWDVLVRVIREGDCPMTFLYGLTRIARAIANAYVEAKFLDQGTPAKLRGAKAPALLAALKDADLRTRFCAADMLGAHKAPGVADALIARVADAKEHWLVRKNAILALGRLKATRATPILGAMLKNKQADLAHFATLALKDVSKVVTPSGLADDEPKLEPLEP